MLTTQSCLDFDKAFAQLGRLPRAPEKLFQTPRRPESDGYLLPGGFALPALGGVQRDDRRDGQALSGRASSHEIAIRLGADRALPWACVR